MNGADVYSPWKLSLALATVAFTSYSESMERKHSSDRVQYIDLARRMPATYTNNDYMRQNMPVFLSCYTFTDAKQRPIAKK